MSAPHTAKEAVEAQDSPIDPHDPIESVIPMIPIVLPMVGAALIFLLAWIAVYMA
jgi:hypothetical protein